MTAASASSSLPSLLGTTPAAPPAPGRRILALALPNLSIDRVRRKEAFSGGEPDERPLAIVERAGGLLRLVAVDARAAAAGCVPGAALTHARSICPDLRVDIADPREDAAFLGSVADWCDRYTPLVALDPPFGLTLDISGCAHFFGGEAALAEDLVAGLRRQGFMARAAVAGAPGPARALAWFSQGAVPPPGSEAALVAELPIAALRLEEAARLGLVRAGLKTIGDVAVRSRSELAARFGARLVSMIDEALGRAETPISPRRPVPVRMVERRFAEPLSSADAALAVLRALAGSLAARLETAGEGLREAEAAFFRADGKVVRIALGVGAPTRDPDLLLRLFRERLDALADPLDPGFGFDLMRLSALAVEPLTPRPQGFGPGERADDELAELIDRLSARHGRRRVLRFLAGHAHRPEAEAAPRPAQDVREAAAWPQVRTGEPPRRPLRMFARPEPVEVLAEVPDGPPLRFVWRRATHHVVRAEGPERIALEWWRDDEAPLTRDYFRVEDTVGARFWLFRDGLFGREVRHPRWFVHGLFA